MDIRPAATLVLTRDTENGIEVLLLQRTWEAIFLPGYYVFPGGAVNEQESEAQPHVVGVEDADISQTMSLDEGGADFMLAAVRECFEEAGVLLAQDANGKLVGADHQVHGERQALFRDEVSLAQLCEKHGLVVPLDRLAYLSHWVTPPGPPRRFDTRFFVAVAPEGQVAGHDGQETIDHVWISPAQALEEHRAGQRLLGLPTIRTLRVLCDFSSTAELMRYAHANPPEAFPTDPWPALRKGKPVMLEPNAPAYDEAVKLDPDGEGTTRAEIVPGQPVEVAAGVVRLTAPNPGMMTGPGTNTYILGFERFTVIDPGPANSAHIDAILEVTGGVVDQVLVTHTHLDHSPAVSVLKERTGCRVFGWPAPEGAGQDQSFKADDEPEHGDLIVSEAGILKVIHTPGHASNHLCFLLTDQELLFSGDHIMQGSTVVINPPDGDMKAYVESLYELLEEPVRFIAPAHGFLMGQPEAVIDYLITHRLSREHKIFRSLQALAPVSLKDLTAKAYDDVPAAIHGLAARSALAHLLKLEAEQRAYQSDNLWHTH
ncbi:MULTISPECIES: MBL fold metallo-hydrolase [unclassified Marinobacter]|uniref:MBL fold metallo-hydrolase n=1 Tax=unclassified Marinobacter TaxID=83889 RepID=UPI0012688C47|nr:MULTISPECIES: MBL fold metallo-hydrolase [unclassified Marinobacter]QFS88908.1 hydroxyacylglutathione hydrolase [Marinobacter sp. THAF197a]QFT52693.1 hydroxyacylglutathione hydrolase [Marinobacter sp. THAF39]